MLFPMFDTNRASGPLTQTPVRLHQRGAKPYAAMALLLLTPVAATTLLPFAAAAAHATDNASTLELVFNRPTLTLQFAAGLLLWMGLFYLPAKSCIARLARRRTVDLDRHEVTVRDHGLFSHSDWTAELTDFLGIAHVTRTSASGIRHELVLAHPTPRKSIVVKMAPQITQSEIDAVCGHFNLNEISPSKLLRFPKLDLTVPQLLQRQRAGV